MTVECYHYCLWSQEKHLSVDNREWHARQKLAREKTQTDTATEDNQALHISQSLKLLLIKEPLPPQKEFFKISLLLKTLIYSGLGNFVSQKKLTFPYLKKVQWTDCGAPECCPVERCLSKVILMVHLCLDILALFGHCFAEQTYNIYGIRHTVICVSMEKMWKTVCLKVSLQWTIRHSYFSSSA